MSILLTSHRKDAGRSLARLRSDPLSSLMTISVVGIALLLPILLLLLYVNLGQVLEGFQNTARISLFLHASTTESEGIGLSEDLLTDERIDLAAYVSPSQALAEFSNASGFSDSLADLGDNPLPATIIVRPTTAALDSLDSLATDLQQRSEVELVQLDNDWIRRLLAISDLLVIIARLLAVVVLAGLCLIVGNTIRQAIDSRRDEIRVVKLVGGTAGFIARPFLYSGLIIGLLGGAVACLLVGLLMVSLGDALNALSSLYGSNFQVQGLNLFNAGIVVIAGGLIGWLAALVASIRGIAAIEP